MKIARNFYLKFPIRPLSMLFKIYSYKLSRKQIVAKKMELKKTLKKPPERLSGNFNRNLMQDPEDFY